MKPAILSVADIPPVRCSWREFFIPYPYHAYMFKSQPRISRSREVSRASVEFSISPKKYTRRPRERGRRGKAEQQKHGQWIPTVW